MPASASSKTVLIILAGPAGVGKSTLCDRLVKEVPGFERVITATTRPPRIGE
ncbi:MAG: guanylate kinase, partial [Lacunisphaera sp.]